MPGLPTDLGGHDIGLVPKLEANVHIVFSTIEGRILAQFATTRSHKQDKTFLWSLKQGKNESLKNYLDRFNKGANRIEGLTDTDAITTQREGLQEGELLSSMVRLAPKLFVEFLARAQEFINEGEYFKRWRVYHNNGKQKYDSKASGSDSKK